MLCWFCSSRRLLFVSVVLLCVVTLQAVPGLQWRSCDKYTVWCRWKLALCRDLHPTDLEVGVLRARVGLGLLLFSCILPWYHRHSVHNTERRLRVAGTSEELQNGSLQWCLLSASSLCLVHLFVFAPKYAEILVRDSFTSGLVKLKWKSLLFL